jgi:hypothetical protein
MKIETLSNPSDPPAVSAQNIALNEQELLATLSELKRIVGPILDKHAALQARAIDFTGGLIVGLHVQDAHLAELQSSFEGYATDAAQLAADFRAAADRATALANLTSAAGRSVAVRRVARRPTKPAA